MVPVYAQVEDAEAGLPGTIFVQDPAAGPAFGAIATLLE